MNNEYGLDAAYFRKNLEILLRDVDRYTPAEMNRACQRLANVALPHSQIDAAIQDPDLMTAGGLREIHTLDADLAPTMKSTVLELLKDKDIQQAVADFIWDIPSTLAASDGRLR